MPIRYLLFDLDETLYKDTTGLFIEVGDRIVSWMVAALGMSFEDARILRHRYYQAYGTTMAGLLHDHPELDIDAYLDYVHDVDVSRYLARNEMLAEMLEDLPVPKSIFTNSITDWAERVTRQLGVREHFDQIFDVRMMDYRCKPHSHAFNKVLNALQLPGEACVLLDDQISYLAGAAKLGIRTILVRPNSQPSEGIDFAIDYIQNAGPLLHHLIDKG